MIRVIRVITCRVRDPGQVPLLDQLNLPDLGLCPVPELSLTLLRGPLLLLLRVLVLRMANSHGLLLFLHLLLQARYLLG